MSLDPQEIRRVLEALEASSWDEAVITVGDVTIAVARNGMSLAGAGSATGGGTAIAPPAVAPPATAPPAGPAAAATANGASAGHAVPASPAAPEPRPSHLAGGIEVPAPSVGMFWRSPEPGAPPFVEVGARVAAGDTLGIVEVMKLMQNVVAPAAGVVAAILAGNAEPVQYGDTLVVITPDEA